MKVELGPGVDLLSLVPTMSFVSLYTFTYIETIYNNYNKKLRCRQIQERKTLFEQVILGDIHQNY